MDDEADAADGQRVAGVERESPHSEAERQERRVRLDAVKIKAAATEQEVVDIVNSCINECGPLWQSSPRGVEAPAASGK